MTVPESWRIFCAIELPSDLRLQLQEHVRKLRAEIPDVAASWTRVENIHLTLKFFGNVNVDRISRNLRGGWARGKRVFGV